MPEEIVVESFLPTFRALLATELDDRGLTQQEIADYLGVSQPAVSKYVAGEVGVEQRFVEDPRTMEAAGRIADGLVTGDMTGFDALAETLALVRVLEDRGPICEVHEREMPALQGLGCDLCVRGHDSGALDENEVLHDVREAVRRFRNLEGAADHVPNVGSNVCRALEKAEGVDDVAGVPGRIYTMRERIHVPSNPEFGASENVASAVLSASAVDPGVRGALNLATSEELLGAADSLGLEAVEFDPGYEGRWRRLTEKFGETGVPAIAYHRGDFGIEPVLYVFGETAVDAVERTGDLIAAGSGR